MICIDCNKELRERRGTVSLEYKEIGKFDVHDIQYLECPKCNKKLFGPEAGRKIDKTSNSIRDELISNYEIKEFVSLAEACKILDVTRQVFDKNKRIRRGFIYSWKLNGKRYFLKKSVLQFKDTGDGRFLLKAFSHGAS